MKRCIACNKAYLWYEGDYSEMTPGAGAELRCTENHFRFCNEDFSEKNVLKFLWESGGNCLDFEPREQHAD